MPDKQNAPCHDEQTKAERNEKHVNKLLCKTN